MRTILLTITIILIIAFSGCRPAMTAPDFYMENREGQKVSLKEIDSKYTLLYLNDIDCEDCHSVSDSLKNSITINDATQSGKLTILSVYVGENKVQWKEMNPISCRIECIDEKLSVFNQTDYIYETFPALFLLDNKKRFIFQNTSVSQLVDFLKKR